MRTLCITLPEQPERRARAEAHFAEHGLAVQFVHGVNGLKSGLVASHTYEHDHPGTDYHIGPATIGIFLSHIIAWSIIAAGDHELTLILEDDALLAKDFKFKMQTALMAIPDQFTWDMMFLGSCCTEGHAKIHVAGDVWQVKKIQCLHAYIVTREAAARLLDRCTDVYAPIDCLMALNGFWGLTVCAVLPRIASQVNTELPP